MRRATDINELHRGGEECSVAEDVEDIFGCRNEERLALFDSDAIDVRFSPEAYYYDEGAYSFSQRASIPAERAKRVTFQLMVTSLEA